MWVVIDMNTIDTTETDIIFNRIFAMPSAWTFEIKPIKELLNKYVQDGIGWVEPFAGNSKLSEYRNDINHERNQPYCMDALDFCNTIDGEFEGVIFDPPYSLRQVSEHYKQANRKVTALDTSANFYYRVINALVPKIKIGGYAISMGWNSSGFGLNNGFKIIEILLVPHGGYHNDTIVTVEKKVYSQPKLF